MANWTPKDIDAAFKPLRAWTPPPRKCACGTTDCPDNWRHHMRALIEASKADPRWVDPAPFPVPRDAVLWKPARETSVNNTQPSEGHGDRPDA